MSAGGCILWDASVCPCSCTYNTTSQVTSAAVKIALTSPPDLSLEVVVFLPFVGEILCLTFCSHSLRKAGTKFATEHIKDAQGHSILSQRSITLS